MDNLKQFKKDFKRDLLVKVIVDMKYGATSKSRGAEIASRILECFKAEDVEIFRKLNKIAQTHPEILDILIKRMGEFDAREKDQKLNQIHIYFLGGEKN